MIIKFLTLGAETDERAICELKAQLLNRVQGDGRFRINHADYEIVGFGPNRARKHNWVIKIKCVRLIKAKPYCGNHPGPCEVNPFTGVVPPKRKTAFLEWDDWVAFHGLINDFLDSLPHTSEAWTKPPDELDEGQKMYIRRENKRRTEWDWESEWRGGREIRIWNHGTAGQFT